MDVTDLSAPELATDALTLTQRFRTPRRHDPVLPGRNLAVSVSNNQAALYQLFTTKT